MTEAQRDMFTKRFRKVRAPEPSEVQLQIALIQHLRLFANKNVVYFHCPNGEVRDKRTAAKLKAMGVLPGVSDLIFMWPAETTGVHVLFLELKARRAKPSEPQNNFRWLVETIGARYEVRDSLDDALNLLRELGIIRQNVLLT